MIDAGRIETGDTTDLVNYEPVRRLIARPWPYAHDTRTLLPVAQTGVDCGYRTDVVIDFCRQNSYLRVIPVRGDDKVKARVYRKSTVDPTMSRYDLNVNAIKDRLYRLLFETKEPGPGYFHLHRDTSKEIKAHLSSEEQRIFYHGFRKEELWRPKKGAGPNHLWDCAVYATAAAELIGVGRLEAPAVKPTKKPQEQRQAYSGGGFLHDLPRLNQ